VTKLRIAVLVPSFRRPADLQRCLGALSRQDRRPDDVCIVLRRDDTASREVVEAHRAGLHELRVVEVEAPGVVHALNSGLATITTDIVAITDDDAAPRANWLARIADAFDADVRLGGIGGRDWVHHGGEMQDGVRDVVGQMTWYGRCTGNHHLGQGPAHDVDFLKGVNMSFRRLALDATRFDARLRGSGAQVGNDMAFSMAVRRNGWRLRYDAAIAVDHFPGTRHDEDRRNEVSYLACRNAGFNQALIVSEALGPSRAAVFLLWAIVSGTRGEPGLLQVLRLLPEQGRGALTRALATIHGVAEGWSAARW